MKGRGERDETFAAVLSLSLERSVAEGDGDKGGKGRCRKREPVEREKK